MKQRHFHAEFHEDFKTDLDSLDGSLKELAKKKINSIIGNTFGYEGHALKGNLSGFRSASFKDATYKIIFSYCKDCRDVGRDLQSISDCNDCDQQDDDTIRFWRIERHRDGKRDGYVVVADSLSKVFPPKSA
jgi:hypothetical protein